MKAWVPPGRAIVSAIALAMLVPFGIAVAAEAPRASLPDIEDEVMCPICGTTLELSSSPQAERERALIRRLIEAGRTKEEIKDGLVAEYGADVLAAPEDSGFDLAAWVVPIAAGLLAAIGVAGFALRRAGRNHQRPAVPELSDEYARRLQRDLSKYDL